MVAREGRAGQRPNAGTASDRRVRVHRVVLRDVVFHDCPPSKRRRRRFPDSHPPSRSRDGPVSTLVHQSADRPVLQEPTQLANPYRADHLRPRFCTGRQHGGALFDAGVEKRGGFARSRPCSASHHRLESRQRSDGETLFEMSQPGPCCRSA